MRNKFRLDNFFKKVLLALKKICCILLPFGFESGKREFFTKVQTMRHCSFQSGRKKSFSLIELLVVIAIICIL